MYHLFIKKNAPSMDGYHYSIRVVHDKNSGNNTTEYNTCKYKCEKGQITIFDKHGELEILPITRTRIKFIREGY